MGGGVRSNEEPGGTAVRRGGAGRPFPRPLSSRLVAGWWGSPRSPQGGIAARLACLFGAKKSMGGPGSRGLSSRTPILPN